MLYSFDTPNQLAILKKSHLQLFVSSNQETTPIINVITKQPVTKIPLNNPKFKETTPTSNNLKHAVPTSLSLLNPKMTYKQLAQIKKHPIYSRKKH